MVRILVKEPHLVAQEFGVETPTLDERGVGRRSHRQGPEEQSHVEKIGELAVVIERVLEKKNSSVLSFVADLAHVLTFAAFYYAPGQKWSQSLPFKGSNP